MVRRRLRELAVQRPRWGSPRLHWLLAREGLVVNHKRTERLYAEEHLTVACRRRRKRVSVPRVVPPAPTAPQARWSMDFVRDERATPGELVHIDAKKLGRIAVGVIGHRITGDRATRARLGLGAVGRRVIAAGVSPPRRDAGIDTDRARVAAARRGVARAGRRREDAPARCNDSAARPVHAAGAPTLSAVRPAATPARHTARSLTT